LIPSLYEGGHHSPRGTGGYLFRCRGAGLKRAAFWRELGFPNLVRARAAYAKIRAERRRQQVAKQFGPFAIANERYEDLAPPPKPSRPRRKQVYKSRVVGKYQQE